MLETPETQIQDSIDKTIRETQQEIDRQRQSGESNPTVIMNMNEHRRRLENNLDYQRLTHQSPLKVIATLIVGPVSIVLAPVVILGGLAYLGMREVYRKIKKEE